MGDEDADVDLMDADFEVEDGDLMDEVDFADDGEDDGGFDLVADADFEDDGDFMDEGDQPEFDDDGQEKDGELTAADEEEPAQSVPHIAATPRASAEDERDEHGGVHLADDSSADDEEDSDSFEEQVEQELALLLGR
ncbi:nucleolin-like [Oryza brachyantha]|nr:nucleolin-like [Oryza brachyantha]